MYRPFSWTPEAIDLLHKLFKEGKSASQTATALVERFGGTATRNSVIGKWNRLGLSNTRVRKKATEDPSANVKKPKEPPKAVDPRPTPIIKSKPKAVVIPLTGRVALMDLGNFDCRFPIGDPVKEGFGFCGVRAKSGSAYCSEHHAVCYQPNKFREDWDKRILRQSGRAA